MRALKAGGGCWKVFHLHAVRYGLHCPFINFVFCPFRASCYIHANVCIDGMRNGGIFLFFLFSCLFTLHAAWLMVGRSTEWGLIRAVLANNKFEKEKGHPRLTIFYFFF